MLPVYSAFVSREILQEQLFSKDKVNKKLTLILVTNIVIYNTDPENSITQLTLDYYDSDGVVLKKLLPQAMMIKPMAARSFVINGSEYESWGAKLLITWQSDILVNEPIIEGLSTGSKGQNGFSFSTQGKPIQARTK